MTRFSGHYMEAIGSVALGTDGGKVRESEGLTASGILLKSVSVHSIKQFVS